MPAIAQAAAAAGRLNSMRYAAQPGSKGGTTELPICTAVNIGPKRG